MNSTATFPRTPSSGRHLSITAMPDAISDAMDSTSQAQSSGWAFRVFTVLCVIGVAAYFGYIKYYDYLSQMANSWTSSLASLPSSSPSPSPAPTAPPPAPTPTSSPDPTFNEDMPTDNAPPEYNYNQTQIQPQRQQQTDYNIKAVRKSALDRALDNAAARQTSAPSEVSAIVAASTIGTSGKSGWCLTGQEVGVNICAEVGVNDKCMSGTVYPSQAICMNPTLRP